MWGILSLSAILLTVFAASVGISYGLARVLRRRPDYPPTVGARTRFTVGNSVYRSRFAGVIDGAWAFEAPLSRDAYVPIRPGERVVFQCTEADGVAIGRSEVAWRDAVSHLLFLRPPERVFRSDRRISPRQAREAKVRFEGQAADLVDVSREGVRIRTAAVVRCGERVRIDLDWLAEPAFGWVLAAETGVVRVRFESLIDLP